MVKDVTDFVILGVKPKYKFPNLKEAITLQKLLNEIDASKYKFSSVKYNRLAKRVLLTEESGFERLDLKSTRDVYTSLVDFKSFNSL
ncbi:hypothetical protein [Bacillus badius]|uniref:Uncharacterized protein n=1 Tax=Bacillus badius TaxID=1455 RepID=A0ABR5ARM1_BACBA|nr:hypothetical protein [Bacillus badius]KIL77387.1 hypothetical protein SD77_1373 [Bacillus badius]KZN98177.1 hypothetical protein A4244_10475 [Bacillus badius]MED0666719.1 hypothetical protein [Bacillus badius]MED4717269.1 hypothetical protein [Bacillus badius]OCS82503.1 hypothetical protein A6M11_10490 [Bacillus badius]